MTVKIITDSTSDISPEMARRLGVDIVPIYVRFGDEIYRDGVDITSVGLMEKLKTLPLHPATSQPSPSDFYKVYLENSKNYDGIISIHISAKISGTYNSAVIAKDMIKQGCRIEIIDSKLNSAGLALIVMRAVKMAASGANMEAIIGEMGQIIQRTEMLGVFGTMKYLAKGGRVNKAIANVGSLMDIKPLLAFKDGEIVRAGMVRTFNKGIERLYRFVAGKNDIEELAIAHSAIPNIAERFRDQLGNIFPVGRIWITQLGAALGVHGGPGVLLVALIGGL